MKLSLACLCDYAADYQGKLTTVGAFDTIWARKFPSTHPQCSVALRIVFRDEDEGDHQIGLQIVNPDGELLIPEAKCPRVRFRMGRLPEKVFFVTRNFVFHFQGLTVPAPGQYEIQIYYDDGILTPLPLQFVETPSRRPPQAG